MKNFLVLTVSLLIVRISYAQTAATDFTANDCNGSSHSLFTDLDAGKIVVIVWVMPCGACISVAKTTYNVAKSYEALYPGRVVYYLVDDYADIACTSISSWASSNGVSSTSVFSSPAIKMSDYGAAGMNKVVVLGGSNHAIFYNIENTVNSSNMQKAINSALGVTDIQENTNSINTFKVYPNPAKDKTFISYSLKETTNVKIEIHNILGEKVSLVVSEKQNAGKHEFEINTGNLSSGSYFVNVNGNTFKFQVSK